MFRLKCKVQEYAWGKKGDKSFIKSFVSSKKVNSTTPYAELWMGTHKNGETIVLLEEEKEKEKEVRLSEYIKTLSNEKRGFKGEGESESEGLPFLFKILSVGEPLSIQLHPPKEKAKELFEKDKEHYKDGNHKPELAIALTEFESLAGFRKYQEIEKYCNDIPELKRLLIDNPKRDKIVLKKQSDIKDMFKRLIIDVDQKDVEKSLKETFSKYISKKKRTDEEELFLKVYEKYSKDRCCYCVYFFNYYKLQPGESIFIKPSIPHCYLSGDLVECMANSDNVIRAGFTPKFVDKENLMRILDFESQDSLQFLPIGYKNEKNKVVEYKNDDFKEFKVVKVSLKKDEKVLKFSLDALSIMIVTNGNGVVNGKEVKVGDVFLLHAKENMDITSNSSEMLIYFGTVN